LLIGVLVLFLLSVVVFIMLRVVPGSDAAQLICQLQCTPDGLAAAREEMGLNDPYPVQYWNWLGGVLTGDLGTSFVNYRPVSESIAARFPITLELMILTLLITVIVGVPAGVISAIWKNSVLDYLVRLTAIFGLAVPAFWVATLVLILPLEWWGYAPPLGRHVPFTEDPIGNLKQFIPPAGVLAVGSAAGVMRLTRSSLLEVLRQDYMRTALAKGLRQRTTIVRHGLKNSLIPVVTVLGLQVSGLLGGAIIVEQIFALPGLGVFTFESLGRKDFPVAQTMTLYAGITVVVLNLVVDISYAWLDPRIRYS
jgi:peptide/nickel transport system permease protein